MMVIFTCKWQSQYKSKIYTLILEKLNDWKANNEHFNLPYDFLRHKSYENKQAESIWRNMLSNDSSQMFCDSIEKSPKVAFYLKFTQIRINWKGIFYLFSSSSCTRKPCHIVLISQEIEKSYAFKKNDACRKISENWRKPWKALKVGEQV